MRSSTRGMAASNNYGYGQGNQKSQKQKVVGVNPPFCNNSMKGRPYRPTKQLLGKRASGRFRKGVNVIGGLRDLDRGGQMPENSGLFYRKKNFPILVSEGWAKMGNSGVKRKRVSSAFQKGVNGVCELGDVDRSDQNTKIGVMGYVQILLFAISCGRKGLTGPIKTR